VNQLVEKLIVLLDCPEKIREFGGRARESADKTLLENPADDIIYEKCLQAKGAANPHASKLLRSAVRWQQNAIQVVETRHKQDLQTIADRDQKIQAMKAAAAEREARIAQCEQETSAIRNSTTWKLASLVRRALAKLRL
jgi:hypothetical protein